ncbi:MULTISPECIES: Fic/DOC family protein [unclassified Mycolicibacterium]|uniref:Fic/DOC family protein n=1 Tax=unclassified Mycolicibacterium TaxID=2636767 RepID=UPI002ED8D580
MPRRSSYVDPTTGILTNLVHARTIAELVSAEHDLVTVRHIQLSEHPLPGDFDLEHLKAIHRHLFGDVYPFAGQLRTVDIFKAGSTSQFAPARTLVAAAAHVFVRIQEDDYLCGLDRDEFVEGLSRHFTAINRLHPFREGNGRTQRVFLQYLAEHAGYQLDWSRIDRRALLATCRDRTLHARCLMDAVTLPQEDVAGSRAPEQH